MRLTRNYNLTIPPPHCENDLQLGEIMFHHLKATTALAIVAGLAVVSPALADETNDTEKREEAIIVTIVSLRVQENTIIVTSSFPRPLSAANVVPPSRPPPDRDPLVVRLPTIPMPLPDLGGPQCGECPWLPAYRTATVITMHEAKAHCSRRCATLVSIRKAPECTLGYRFCRYFT